MEDEIDIYTEEGVAAFFDDDEISYLEECFMAGYIAA